MRPLTLYQPKELLPVGRQPALRYLVDELACCGLREVLLITSAEKQAIEALFAATPFTSWTEVAPARAAEAAPPVAPRIWSVRQDEPRGLADALRYAEDFCAGEPFVLALGDCLMVSPPHGLGDGQDDGLPFVARLIAAHEQAGAVCTLGVEPVARERTSSYGIVAPRAAGLPEQPEETAFALRDIVEKPHPDAAPSTLAVAGRYVCGPPIFEALRRLQPSPRGEYELPDALRDLLAQGLGVQALCRRADERRYDVGSPTGYIAAFLALAPSDPAGQQALALLPSWARTALAPGAHPAEEPSAGSPRGVVPPS